jgi:hypothetical protein
MEIDRFVGTAELYQVLGVGHTKLYDIFKTGKLTAIKQGTKTGARASDVNRYLDTLPKMGSSTPPRAA